MDLLVLSWWDFGQKLAISMGLLAILDYGWARQTKARYFSLHGLWNIIITIIIIPDLFKTLSDPLHAMMPGIDCSRWPIILVVAIHLWHCVAYKKLNFDDYLHHFVFVAGMSPTNLIWDWGYSTNFLLFFICGLPGGLDYLMLAAVKHGYIKKISEKRINKLLNVWCRGPGCIAAACLIWINWMSGQTGHIPSWVKVVIILLSIANGQYYSRRVVASWAIHEDHLEQKKSQEKSLKISQEMTPVYCCKCKEKLETLEPTEPSENLESTNQHHLYQLLELSKQTKKPRIPMALKNQLENLESTDQLENPDTQQTQIPDEL